MQLERIIYYPVKSLKGVEVESHTATPLGLQWDRRWMVVEKNGDFVSQRRDPVLATLDVKPVHDGWLLSHPSHGTVLVPHALSDQSTRSVTLWGDVCPGMKGPLQASTFLSDFLNRPVDLVYHYDDHSRPVDNKYAQSNQYVGFADGFPYLILSLETIEFCQRLSPEEAIDWRRFRPNIVVSGVHAFAEDDWRCLQIGNAVFDLVKPCARCVMITVDPITGQKSSDLLNKLRPIRSRKSGIMVGQNAILHQTRRINTADPVGVLDWSTTLNETR